jgi:hypothetical protein
MTGTRTPRSSLLAFAAVGVVAFIAGMLIMALSIETSTVPIILIESTARQETLRIPTDYTQSYPHLNNPGAFKKIAEDAAAPSTMTTDKISYHSYQIMYGMFLLPLAEQFKAHKKPLKMLEIGLGCDMGYGSGKSVSVWKLLLGDNSDIWEGEFRAECVAKAKLNGQLDGINTVVGDQGDFKVLESWVVETKGEFDVIIDDGGHDNLQIYNSFNVLFNKALRPGGLYFIEDLQVGYARPLLTDGSAISVVIQCWIDQLLVPTAYIFSHPQAVQCRQKYPIPPSIKWIFCQFEACVIAKCEHKDPSACKYPIGV